MDVYSLSRNFWDYAYENPELIKPNHCALYFFAIEHCNRLGWKQKFGLPSTMAMDAIGIKSHNTYSKTLNDLVEFGLITMIQHSKNQYSANIIAISKFDKAHDKALDRALIKHGAKQRESTIQSIDSIDIPINNITNLPINKITFSEMLSPFTQELNNEYDNFYSYWTEKNAKGKERWEAEKFFDISRRIKTWLSRSKNFNNGNSNNEQKLGTSAARMAALKQWGQSFSTETYASDNG
jgi:hypothetical protein